MTKNQILTSSDHHANWDALEKLFQIAKEKEIPFVINGDIIGDYNFDDIKEELSLRYPSEIFGNDFQTEMKKSTNILKLKSLYQIIIKTHAEKLGKLIEKYNVETYFLLGNHEPENFVDLTISKMKNKDLLKDLGKIKRIKEVNGIRIAGIPNVSAIMHFIYEIYSDSEINKMFNHQTGKTRPIVFRNVTKENIELSKGHENDEDWIRIMNDEDHENPDLDIFFTHGQVGTGAWRDDKICNEMPTLHASAKLSSISKLTIDGHLHTTHEMTNPLGKKTLRAVGNKGFLLTKNEYEEIEKELIEVDAEYDTRGKINLSHLNLEEEILNEMKK
jgi:hypothetical protein